MTRVYEVADPHGRPTKILFLTSGTVSYGPSLLPVLFKKSSFFFQYNTSLPTTRLCVEMRQNWKLNLKRNIGASVKKIYKVNTLALLITELYDRSSRFKNHDLKIKV